MSVDALVHATASLTLEFSCCNECCKPTFFFLADDPTEEIISRSSKHKFYVVKKGSVGSEGIYSHWDVAKTKVLGISGALHESSPTADGARAIWARHCHRFHMHRSPQPASAPAPPPYQSRANAPSPPRSPSTPTRAATSPLRSPAFPRTPSALTIPGRFYRVSGSPRVLINQNQAEAELLSAQGSTLLVGNSLREVEDDNDDEVIQAGGARFYRVFGSPRVGTSRTFQEWLKGLRSPGTLLHMKKLDLEHNSHHVDVERYTFLPTFYPAAAYRSLIVTYEPACPNYIAGFNYIECGESVECAWSFAMGSAKRRNARDMPALVPSILKAKL
ncbi:hypothetical protein B0H14DRAFT_2632499 [Mycena olivaceomarginata]|nr:hypothetical protein B0H14DRAFT_2632499 [Mycena olivaceomarginata]